MGGRWTRSWDMMAQSGKVLRRYPHLLMFPVLSFLCFMLFIALIVSGMIGFVVAALGQHSPEVFSQMLKASIDAHRHSHAFTSFSAFKGLIVALSFIGTQFVMTFFNSALIGCVIYHFQSGQTPTISMGLRIAWARKWQILQWSLVAGIVGYIISFIQERTGFIGTIITSLMGFAWAAASYFVVPVLIVEGHSPVTAVRKSLALIKRAWGEGVIGTAGFTLFYMLAIAGIFVPLVFVVGQLSPGASLVLILFCILVAMAVSVMEAIFNAAVYMYASSGKIPSGFSQLVITQALRRKNDG